MTFRALDTEVREAHTLPATTAYQEVENLMIAVLDGEVSPKEAMGTFLSRPCLCPEPPLNPRRREDDYG